MEEREIAVNFIIPDIIDRMEEEQKSKKELHEAMRESAHRAYVAENEWWEHEKPKVEAEAARTAQMLFARNMKKLKARLHDAADGSITPT